MKTAFAKAFEEWDRRYREHPEEFGTAVDHLLRNTPATYGEACAEYFTILLNELAGGKAWNTIGELISREDAALIARTAVGDGASEIERDVALAIATTLLSEA